MQSGQSPLRDGMQFGQTPPRDGTQFGQTPTRDGMQFGHFFFLACNSYAALLTIIGCFILQGGPSSYDIILQFSALQHFQHHYFICMIYAHVICIMSKVFNFLFFITAVRHPHSRASELF